MVVKVCGITRLDDAEAAVRAGAGAIGFIFWPKSPRFIDPHHAKAIAAALPPMVTTVGVFVNQAPGYVNAVATLARLGAVQLHGDETMDDVVQITRPILKAVAVRPGAETVVDVWPSRVTILLDAYDEERRGGTGRTIDWATAAAIAAKRRAILAGGLTPENVADAVRLVRPFGIDVSSGVEQTPGIKDHGRIRAFFEAVHAIDHAARS